MSRSGSLRQSISTLKRYLVERLQRATDTLAQPIPDNTDDCNDLIDTLTEVQELIDGSIQKIELKDKDWQNLISDLDDTAIRAEQQIYEQVATAEPGGYMSTLHEAQSKSSRISTQVRKLNRTVASLNKPPPSPAIGASYNSASGHPPSSRVKTPKIVLPLFDGDILKWKEFWSIFCSTIHNRDDFTGVEKFTYLLPQLEGRAQQAIEGLLITDENYGEAVAILKQRFDRSNDRIVSLLYGELKQLPRCGTNRDEKRKTFDTCERIFRQLSLADEDVNSSRTLTIDFLSKFPAPMVRDLHRHYNVDASSKLSDARVGVEKSISELESTSGLLDDLDAIAGFNTKHNPNTNSKRQNGKPISGQQASGGYDSSEGHEENSVFSTLAKSAEPTSTRSTTPHSSPASNCYFCGGSHFNGDCGKYTTARQREQRLFELKRCIKCARNHNAGGKRNQCNNPSVKCVHCKTQNDHYSALCHTRYPEKLPVKDAPAQQSHACVAVEEHTVSDMTILNNSAGARNSLFQTAKVIIVNPKSGEQNAVRLCLDTLSNRSYSTERAADALNLSSHQSDKLLVSVFGSQKSIQVPTRLVEFGIIQADGSIQHMEANTTKIISNSGVLPSNWPKREADLLNSMKRTHTLADDPFDIDKSVDILVGADYAWEFITGEKINTSTGIYFIPSSLGLMLAGQLKHEEDSCGDLNQTSTMLCIVESSQTTLHDVCQLASAHTVRSRTPCIDVDEYWNLETIGITDCPIEDEDEKAMEAFQKTVYFDNGRYQVTWPWIEEKKCLLPSNYDVALRRFKSLSTRLQSNEDLLQGYRDVVKLQLERGIIEKVPENQVTTTNVVHYLPHHPVVKTSSATTKIRIVYDASSKLRKDDLALNQCLLRGPVILPDLCQLLMRFRVHPTAVISDIEKAFLQVSLQETERDVTRFIWYDDDSSPDVNVLAIYRFCRVAFGINSSSFLLAATILFHLAKEGTAFAKSLEKDIYVDNLISGLDSQNPIDYYHAVKALFAKAGMNLYELCSNSQELMESIPDCDRVKNLDVKVLGMKWDSRNDDTVRLADSSAWNSNRTLSTKRGILQAVASVFDPLGFFQPVLFVAKVFLQKLWTLELSWDATISDELTDEWNSIATSVQGIFQIRLPRYIGNVSNDDSIIVFSDASAKGYGAVAYLRCRDQSGKWKSNLIFAKSQLAPMPCRAKDTKKRIRQVTLPRLELMGATIAATAAEFCRRAFHSPHLKVNFFIDSECVLQWIRSKHTLKRFVDRRVEKIREVKDCTFHYVNTIDNPADYLTRGKTADELIREHKWWHGPGWLLDEERDWPETRLDSTSDETLREIAAETKSSEVCHTLAALDARLVSPGLFGINPNTFSSLRRLIRVTIITLKFLKKRLWAPLSDETKDECVMKPIFDELTNDASITARDVTVATNLWVFHVQSTAFSKVFESIRANKRYAMVSQLGLRVDENGILRSCSRFANADLPHDAKNPMLLPKDHGFSTLVVDDVHESLFHSGVSHTLSEVRRQFWIPRGRSFVRKILKKCALCRLFKTARPFALPAMPPWPKERVARSVPFEYTGLDYFGPIKIRVNDSSEKMWACLFTCLATRAVHIEAVTDCTSIEFLNCLIRFISRRGCPKQIISDNAAQFHLVKILADRAWKRTPVDDSVTSYSAHRGIQWKFIIELAPWQGGHYERLVGVVKSVLRTAVGRRMLTWMDLITLLTETEAIVNSRPITYVGADIESQMRVLRPIDFLVSQPIAPAVNEEDFPTRDLGDSGKRLCAIWKQRKRQLDKLWQHWYDEYVLSLRESGNSNHKKGRGDNIRSPREGEVVLLQDKDAPRGSWRLARVEELLTGVDGHVRGARIKLSNGIELRRAVNFLIPLEIDDGCDDTEIEAMNNDTGTMDNDINDFLGFTPDEVQRAIDAIQYYRDNDSVTTGQ